MNLLDSIDSFWDILSTLWTTLVDMITSAVEALITFHTMLDEFDARIIAMTDSCGVTEFDGLPVVEAIAMYRYLVGDVVFYLIYMLVLFGCLFTIFKLVVLIYAKFNQLTESFTGSAASSSNFMGLLTKLFK